MSKTDIEAALADTKWNAWTRFLDSINSVEELAEVHEYLDTNHPSKFSVGHLGYYKKLLQKWPNPELTSEFRQKFPLVSAKLNTPAKIRVFMRGAEFCDADLEFLAGVAESVIHEHEVEGAKIVWRRKHQPMIYGDDQHNKLCFVLSVLGHYTQLQAWALSDLLLTGKQSSGCDSDGFEYFDWRTKDERIAAGERW